MRGASSSPFLGAVEEFDLQGRGVDELCFSQAPEWVDSLTDESFGLLTDKCVAVNFRRAIPIGQKDPVMAMLIGPMVATGIFSVMEMFPKPTLPPAGAATNDSSPRACVLGICGGDWERVIDLTAGTPFRRAGRSEKQRAEDRLATLAAVNRGFAGGDGYKKLARSLGARRASKNHERHHCESCVVVGTKAETTAVDRYNLIREADAVGHQRPVRIKNVATAGAAVWRSFAAAGFTVQSMVGKITEAISGSSDLASEMALVERRVGLTAKPFKSSRAAARPRARNSLLARQYRVKLGEALSGDKERAQTL